VLVNELLGRVDAILGQVRPALARANRIGDEMDELHDRCLFWDATGLNAFSLLVEELCATPQRHDRIDWLAGG